MLRALCLLAISAGSLSLIACSSSKGSGGFTGSGSGSGTESGSGTGSGSGSGPLTATSFCESVVTAEATLLAHCLGGAETSWQAELSQTAACSNLAAAVTAGRVKFESSEVAACLAAYPATSCTSTSMPPSACTAALTGTVATGGTCYASLDCSGEAYCKGLGGTECSGTCTAKLAAAATCTAGEICVAGYTCTAGTCTATPAPATPATSGETCGYDSTSKTVVLCGTGLSCNTSGTTKVCVKTVQEGAACIDGASECETFTYCDPTTKTCKPDPGAGSGCGVESGQDVIDCATGTFCKGTTGTVGVCTTLGATNATCTAANQCTSGICKKPDGGTSGTCAAACGEE